MGQGLERGFALVTHVPHVTPIPSDGRAPEDTQRDITQTPMLGADTQTPTLQGHGSWD